MPEEFRSAIAKVFPELSQARLTLHAKGWDCFAVEADDRLIFKFPRHETGEKALLQEASLLSVVRPAVTMPVPEPHLVSGPPLFSWHVKLKGEHLLPAQYDRLSEEARRRLAEDLALFFAELHSLDTGRMEAAGARPVTPWLAPEDILARAIPVLPPELRPRCEAVVARWRALPPDPHGTRYGFFDGHGWNMAFDHAAGRLNGIYDFGDSGFGNLHQEFVYPTLVSRDLAERTVGNYEALTGRRLDRQRIEILSGMLRLSELAEYADDPEHRPMMLDFAAEWFRD